jgi:hypothetical protein
LQTVPTGLYESNFGYGSRGFGSFLASHESSFKVPSDCYTMASHRVLGLTTECTSHVRKCPRCNEAPSESRGSGSSSTVSSTSMSGERSTTAKLMNHIPGTRALGTSFGSTIILSTCLKSSCLKRGLLSFKWRDLRLEVRRIRLGASRDRHGDVV